MTATRKDVLPGVWTPWAEVLCRPCHGPRFLEQTIPEEEHDRLCVPISEKAVPKEDCVTSCDRCGRRCHVSVKVAYEHELATALKSVLKGRVKDVGMEQTGGMCSAVGVSLHGGQKSIFMVADEENDEPRYTAGILDGDSCEETPLDAEGREADNWTSLTREQAVEVARRVVASFAGED